jgi:hypothetical protein
MLSLSVIHVPGNPMETFPVYRHVALREACVGIAAECAMKLCLFNGS